MTHGPAQRMLNGIRSRLSDLLSVLWLWGYINSGRGVRGVRAGGHQAWAPPSPRPPPWAWGGLQTDGLKGGEPHQRGGWDWVSGQLGPFNPCLPRVRKDQSTAHRPPRGSLMLTSPHPHPLGPRIRFLRTMLPPPSTHHASSLEAGDAEEKPGLPSLQERRDQPSPRLVPVTPGRTPEHAPRPHVAPEDTEG